MVTCPCQLNTSRIECKIHRRYRCAWCRRLRLWAEGAGDVQYMLCDDCWQENNAEAHDAVSAAGAGVQAR